MADQDRPNQSSHKSKAEGERWSSEQHSVRDADRDAHPEAQYQGDNREDAVGISNRPLSEEVDKQADLPERGTDRDRTDDPEARQPEGDYEEGDR